MLSFKWNLKIYVKIQNTDTVKCPELRVDMLCIWLHHPGGGGAVVSVGYALMNHLKFTCILFGWSFNVLLNTFPSSTDVNIFTQILTWCYLLNSLDFSGQIPSCQKFTFPIYWLGLSLIVAITSDQCHCHGQLPWQIIRQAHLNALSCLSCDQHDFLFVFPSEEAQLYL